MRNDFRVRILFPDGQCRVTAAYDLVTAQQCLRHVAATGWPCELIGDAACYRQAWAERGPTDALLLPPSLAPGWGGNLDAAHAVAGALVPGCERAGTGLPATAAADCPACDAGNDLPLQMAVLLVLFGLAALVGIGVAFLF